MSPTGKRSMSSAQMKVVNNKVLAALSNDSILPMNMLCAVTGVKVKDVRASVAHLVSKGRIECVKTRPWGAQVYRIR